MYSRAVESYQNVSRINVTTRDRPPGLDRRYMYRPVEQNKRFAHVRHMRI